MWTKPLNKKIDGGRDRTHSHTVRSRKRRHTQLAKLHSTTEISFPPPPQLWLNFTLIFRRYRYQMQCSIMQQEVCQWSRWHSGKSMDRLRCKIENSLQNNRKRSILQSNIQSITYLQLPIAWWKNSSSISYSSIVKVLLKRRSFPKRS